MDVERDHSGRWRIIHAGREVAEDFESEDEAWAWADKNIDDQMFDAPNHYSPPLRRPRPRCDHCGAKKITWAGLCSKCMRFGTPRDNRVQ
jgi:hypothetical protein